MTGKIVKGIAGFYYVTVVGSGTYECRARGIFRKDGVKPVVGDLAEIEVLDEETKEANLTGLLPRKNELIRPVVANIDQAMLIFALRQPEPDASLIDRFLVSMERQKIPVFLCFNKEDLAEETDAAYWRELYERCGYGTLLCSAKEGLGLEELFGRLRGKTTVVAGPSGVGKSSLVNLLQKDVVMDTGEISRKLRRGRHTTRHAELLAIDEASWICDTPGFTSLYLPEMEKEELETCFPEFAPYRAACRFGGCAHREEPDCAVRGAVEEGAIPEERYRSYLRIYEELKDQEKRRY